MELVFDIEANGLLDDSSIDYLASPYKLKPSYKFHCLVIYNRTIKEMLAWGPDDFVQGVEYIKQNATVLIGHNIIDYDLLALKLGFDFDYTITPKHTICGREVKIVDTLVMSKTLNPDRLGHSIEWWGNKLGCQKIDWRGKAIEIGLIPHNAPKAAEFATYHPEMLEYNKQDVIVNNKVYDALLEEKGSWNWDDALELEHAVRDIITRQSHRGFWFNRDKAEANVRELDEMMAATRAEVEPHLPPKPMTKGKLADSTPPKNQFKKDGSVSALMLKFADKVGATIEDGMFVWNGQMLALPLPAEALITEEPASIEDTTHIKGWLISLGWNPVNYKERDLTCDAKKKKLTQEKYLDAVERYKEQTVGGPFEKDLLEHLASYLRCSKLLVWKKMEEHDITRPMKVLTNPTLTVGQDKELCPNLELLAEKFPYAEKIVKFLTYRHRRNSILGGGVGLDDEDAEMEKGFLANVRADGRIATPADTCGCNTSRMKHRVVANIPRITSLYGEPMREIFGIEKGKYAQFGYDFSSLEGRMEAHYCWKYDPTKEYCHSLVLEKPHDVHTITALKISDIIGKEFGRTPAKSVKYCCTYGGRPPRVAKTIGSDLKTGEAVYDAFWLAASPLKLLNDNLKRYWETTGGKKFILGIDGRKVPTRSASALVNSLLQSAGVICAKWTMVLHEEKLREVGLVIDFFRDDWKNMKYVQQMIQCHDEAQMEVSKGLIEWKVFSDEQEAKTFKKTHEGWSEVGHQGQKFFVGKSIVADLLVEAVNETTAKLKLNIPLGVEYVYGTGWHSCH